MCIKIKNLKKKENSLLLVVLGHSYNLSTLGAEGRGYLVKG